MPHAAWPVDPGMIVPFLAAIILVELTPGPNMAYLAALSATHGRRAGLVAVAGVTCGLSVYMLAAVFGLTEVFRLYRPLYELLRWAGAAYLVWLAWDAWRGSGEANEAVEAMPAPWTLFRRGLLTNLLNPKAALFYVSLLPGFIQTGHASPTFQALILGSIHVAVSMVVHGAIVLGADRAGRLVTSVRSSVWSTRGLALAILAVAIWVLWQTRETL
jgi:threonine/homoserine/homoserine lactone efflux protein